MLSASPTAVSICFSVSSPWSRACRTAVVVGPPSVSLTVKLSRPAFTTAASASACVPK